MKRSVFSVNTKQNSSNILHIVYNKPTKGDILIVY
jgi:hypothetical protein